MIPSNGVIINYGILPKSPRSLRRLRENASIVRPRHGRTSLHGKVDDDDDDDDDDAAGEEEVIKRLASRGRLAPQPLSGPNKRAQKARTDCEEASGAREERRKATNDLAASKYVRGIRK